MAKRKMSTFERLQRGQLNRNARKELGRKLNSAEPGLTIVHPDAAGIDPRLGLDVSSAVGDLIRPPRLMPMRR